MYFFFLDKTTISLNAMLRCNMEKSVNKTYVQYLTSSHLEHI